MLICTTDQNKNQKETKKNQRGTVREKKERRKKENTHHALSVTSLKKLVHKKKSRC